MVRCWLEVSEEPAWRFSLLKAGSSSPRHGFTRLDDLMAFLEREMAAAEAAQRASTDRLIEVFQRVRTDEECRRCFMANPRQVLAEAGLQIPAEMTYRVVENTPDCIYIVLPPLDVEAE